MWVKGYIAGSVLNAGSNSADREGVHLMATKHKGWFERCVKGVKASGSAADAKAVCGAVLKRKRAENPSGVDLHIGNRKKHFDSEEEAYRYALDARRGGLHSEFAIVDVRTGIRREFTRAGKRRNPGLKEVSFTTDKRGRPIAYKFTRGAISPRNIRIGYDQAKLLVSTGQAKEIPYRPMRRAWMATNPAWLKMADGRTKAQAEALTTKLKREDRKLRAMGSSGTYSAVEVRQTFDGPKGKEYGVFVVMREENPKRNPEAGAVAMREKFTGLPADSTVIVERSEHVHEHLAALGDLIELRGKTIKGQPFVIEFKRSTNPRRKSEDIVSKVGSKTSSWLGRRAKSVSKLVKGFSSAWINRRRNPNGPVLLCCNEEGSHLFIEGGDQSINLGTVGLGELNKKEVATIGEVYYIVYHCRKRFAGEKEEEHDYEHKFSEDSDGPRPTLRYDVKNRHLFLDGGVYHIPHALFGASQGLTD